MSRHFDPDEKCNGAIREKVFLVVHIRQMHHIEMLLGYENSRRLLAEVGHYLTALCGKFCVSRNAEDTFTILLDEGKEEHIKGQIKKDLNRIFMCLAIRFL